jgi:hypothetical protein
LLLSRVMDGEPTSVRAEDMFDAATSAVPMRSGG